MLDAMLDMSLEDSVANIPISSEVKGALLGNENDLHKLLSLAISYEKGDWERVPGLCKELKIQESSLPAIYTGALEWSEKIFDF